MATVCIGALQGMLVLAFHSKSMLGKSSVSSWDYNIRISTIMGIVWAGGIGTDLIRVLGTRQFQKFFAILLLILTTLVLINLVASQFRKHLK